jgi:hypothetical protein
VGKTVVASTALYLHLFFFRAKNSPGASSTLDNLDFAESYECIEMFRVGILHTKLDNFLDAGKCLINSFSERVAAFELGTGYDEDPILIGLYNDGNMDRFHIQIIGILASMLFCITCIVFDRIE